jgi:hypothetical protein
LKWKLNYLPFRAHPRPAGTTTPGNRAAAGSDYQKCKVAPCKDGRAGRAQPELSRLIDFEDQFPEQVGQACREAPLRSMPKGYGEGSLTFSGTLFMAG